MLSFYPCTPDALRDIQPIIRQSHHLCSDLSAGALLMWPEVPPQYCIWHNTLTIQRNQGGAPAFSWPAGDDEEGLFEALLLYAKEQNIALRFFGLTGDTIARLREDPRFPIVPAAFERRWSDYLYAAADISEFRGRKYSTQKNHINKYRRFYGEPQIRPLLPEDTPAVLGMLRRYEEEHPGQGSLEAAELRHTRELLSIYSTYGFPAVCLSEGGEIIGFSIGELIGDMLVIHIEKALTSYPGAYPVLFQGFVRYVQELTGNTLRYVNREDDSGDEGLRISKLRYHPIALVHKYQTQLTSPSARLQAILMKDDLMKTDLTKDDLMKDDLMKVNDSDDSAEPAWMSKLPVLKAGGACLTSFRPEDKAAYLRLNTDEENNRWWGYDYREDEWLPSPVTEDTFYESLCFDMAVGDSINFAIRETPEGPMIGEALLWNFTSRGEAEAGCRLFPEYQHKGYGRGAMAACIRLAADTLHLSVKSRCFRENTASLKMLKSCGFREDSTDDTYIYLKLPETYKQAGA